MPEKWTATEKPWGQCCVLLASANIFRSDDRKYVCASQAMLRGTFHTFHEEEIAHLLPQNTAGTARVQRDRWRLLFEDYRLDYTSLYILNYGSYSSELFKFHDLPWLFQWPYKVFQDLKVAPDFNTRAFTCDKFSVKTFSILTRWLRTFAKNNRYHSAVIWNIPISVMVNISWEISA